MMRRLVIAVTFLAMAPAMSGAALAATMLPTALPRVVLPAPESLMDQG